MYKLFVALRYLRANKVIYFSIAGVAVGIMVMIIVTSVMGGFSRDMMARIRGMQAWLEVKARYTDTFIGDYEELARDIGSIPHVTSAAPRIEYAAWIMYKGTYRNAIVIGIDPEQEKKTSDLAKFFQSGGKSFDFKMSDGSEPPDPGVVIGSEMPGSRFEGFPVALLSARMGDTVLPLKGEFVIVGQFKSGMAEYDSQYVFTDLASMQKFMRLAPPYNATPQVNAIAIGVGDYEKNVAEIRQQVAEKIHQRRPCRMPSQHAFGVCGRFEVQTWEQAKGVLLQAVAVERGIQIIILFCIVIVAGFNIVAIYTMMVRAKTRDVGILRSLGATRGGVTLIFLISGGLCGLFGSIVGILGGIAVSHYLNEIVGFVRICSRELNRLAWQGEGVNRVTTLVAFLLYGLAFASLIWSWLRLYKPLSVGSWIRGVVTAILIGAGTLAFFRWASTYSPLYDYDPSLPKSLAWWIGGTAGSGLLLWNVVRAGTERYREMFFGGFIRIVGTLLYSAYVIFLVGGIVVSSALLVSRPAKTFEGWDLFPRQIYYLDRVPVLIDPVTVIGIVLATLFVSVVFSIYPAMRAASYNPVEAIRDE